MEVPGSLMPSLSCWSAVSAAHTLCTSLRASNILWTFNPIWNQDLFTCSQNILIPSKYIVYHPALLPSCSNETGVPFLACTQSLYLYLQAHHPHQPPIPVAASASVWQGVRCCYQCTRWMVNRSWTNDGNHLNIRLTLSLHDRRQLGVKTDWGQWRPTRPTSHSEQSQQYLLNCHFPLPTFSANEDVEYLKLDAHCTHLPKLS